VGDAREDVAEEAVEQRDVLGDELGDDRLGDALDHDLLLVDVFRLGGAIPIPMDADEAVALDAAGADEDGLEGTQAKVVVGLGRQLLGAQLEQRDRLGGQALRRAEPLRVQHHLQQCAWVR
jgi:hypothetical protein